MILAIDPGNHCGMAWRYTTGAFDTVMYFERETNVFEMVQQAKLVVIETFHTAGNISKYGLYTVDLIGGVKGLCWAYDIPIVYHEPYVRLPYIDQSKKDLIKLRGGHKYVVHEMDALAHLLAYETRQAQGMEDIHVNDPKRAKHGPVVHDRRVQDAATDRQAARQSISARLRQD